MSIQWRWCFSGGRICRKKGKVGKGTIAFFWFCFLDHYFNEMYWLNAILLLGGSEGKGEGGGGGGMIQCLKVFLQLGMARSGLLVGRVIVMETFLEVEFGQLGIELVKLFVQGVLQRADSLILPITMTLVRGSSRVNDGPGVTAGGAFTGAEDVQQSIETVEEGGFGRLVDVLDLKGVLDKVIVFLLTCAPDGVEEVVPLADEANRLVGVCVEASGGVFHEGLGPEFDREGFCGLVFAVDGFVFEDRDRVGVERVRDGEFCEGEDCCREMGMGCDGVGFLVLCDSGAADDEGDVCVFLIGGLLAGVHTMGSQMVAVIGGVDNVSVVELAVVFEAFDDSLDELVGCLEGLETGAVFGVEGRNLSVGQARESTDPGRFIVFLWVEVWMTRDLDVFKEVLMSFGGDWGCENSSISVQPDLVMRGRRRDDKQEWLSLVLGQGIQNLDRFVRDNIGLVQSLIARQRSIVDRKDWLVEGIDVGSDQGLPMSGVEALGGLLEGW